MCGILLSDSDPKRENKEGDRGGKLPCIKVENQGTQFQPPLLNLEEQEECV